ncbi:hypothetical protein [Jiangella muralis]|uniref:hypothetical protein n=1 Tax=Jiangella muralis TaxID=702383 RepID=UPI0012F71291|nr:hypothetical protein [Jiangella muralis]
MSSILFNVVTIRCPMERCPGLRLAEDLPPGEIAGQVVDHLERHHVHGDTLIKQLTSLRVDGRSGLELVRTLDRPLIAETSTGRRHAIRPGAISLDGRGPALCSDSNTVRIVELPVFGGPARATAQREPGGVQPECRACQRRLRMAAAARRSG